MIAWRTHVVGALGATMALAVGIALGAGPLQHQTTARVTSGGTGGTGAGADEALDAARAESATLRAGIAYADAVAERRSRSTLDGLLAGRSVSLVLLPGADPAAVETLTGTLARAGARVATEVRLDERLLDVANRQLVSELASQLVRAAGRAIAVPDSMGDYDRLARLLAAALVTGVKGGEPVDRTGRDVLAGLESAGLAEVTGGDGSRGSLALLVAGAPTGTTDQRLGAGEITASLGRGLATVADGVVVTGPPPAGAADGLVGLLRRDDATSRRLSTVDALGSVDGAVTSVLALAADRLGRPGQWGTAGSRDGLAPREPDVRR